MGSLLQTVIVAIVIGGAAAYVVWRVVQPWIGKTGKPGCPSCASGNSCETKSAQPATESTDVHPLILIRHKPH